MWAAFFSGHPGNDLVHLATADKRTSTALVQKCFQRCPLRIVVSHAWLQQVDPLLQHRADA